MKKTRVYVKRQIDENNDTDDNISTYEKKQAIEEYCQKKLSEKPYNEYSKFYFTNPKDYVKLLEYHPFYHSPNVERTLEGINHTRIQRETLDEMKKGLVQLKKITDEFDKTYRQELLDSQELHEFLLSLLEQQEYQRIHNINRYPFALKLFYSLLKIIIDSAPIPIQTHMIKSIKDFFDMANLPVDLGVKDAVPFTRPEIREDQQLDGSVRYTLQLHSNPKIKKQKKK